MTNNIPDLPPLHRRRLLQGIAGTSLLGTGLAASARAATDTTVTVKQGDESFEVDPFNYDNQSIEQFYSYGDPTNASANTPTGLEKSETTRLFFYEDSQGISLVVIHDRPNDGTGGQVQLSFEDLSQGQWVVQDDPNETSYDLNAITHNWLPCCTDGGAIRDVSGQSFTVTPDFRQNIERFELLGGDPESPTVTPLSLSEPLEISVGSPDPIKRKEALIQTIRDQADELVVTEPAREIDSEAEALLGRIETELNAGGDTAQFEEALERLITAEGVTEAAVRTGRDPALETAKSLVELLVLLGFIGIAKVVVSSFGRIGGVLASKLDDFAASARRGVKRLAGRPVLPPSARRRLDEVIDEVDSRINTWFERNSDDLESAGENVVSGSGSLAEITGFLAGSVINALSEIKDFAVGALTVLFYEVYLFDTEERNEDGERIEPPGIDSSSDDRVADLRTAIANNGLDPAGNADREQREQSAVDDFESRRDAFVKGVDTLRQVASGLSLAAAILAVIAVVAYAISAILSATGIALGLAGLIASAASSLVTLAGYLATFVVGLTGLSVAAGFAFLDNNRKKHDAAVDFIINYEQRGGSI